MTSCILSRQYLLQNKFFFILNKKHIAINFLFLSFININKDQIKCYSTLILYTHFDVSYRSILFILLLIFAYHYLNINNLIFIKNLFLSFFTYRSHYMTYALSLIRNHITMFAILYSNLYILLYILLLLIILYYTFLILYSNLIILPSLYAYFIIHPIASPHITLHHITSYLNPPRTTSPSHSSSSKSYYILLYMTFVLYYLKHFQY